MIDYKYSYLIGDLVLLLIWFILYYWRKDVRKEMMFMSLIIGFIGVISEFAYTADWWHPLTITNTRVGIEDFILGFVIGGIAAVCYEEFFKKKMYFRKLSKSKKVRDNKNFVLIILATIIIFFINFSLLGVNSFYSTIIAFIIPLFLILFIRRDLVYDSLISGVLLTVISLISYIVVEWITPGYINIFWKQDFISGIMVLGIPIEDLIWFFFVGAFIGPLYEFWQEGRLVNMKK